MRASLVTGGAGFIGSHLVETLVARGDQVRVLDNFSTGKRSNLASVADQVEIIEGDLRNPDDLQAALNGVELVFHLAALVSLPQSLEEPEECFAVNVQSVLDLMAAARKVGVGRVVLASSAAVYGAQSDMPLNESMPCELLSPYAASKQFNESLAALYTNSFGLETVALRYFNVYGPRQSPDSDYAAVIPKFVERLSKAQPAIVFGDGQQSRDFVHVSDVLRANLLAAEAPEAPGRAINICSGKEHSLLDLLSVLKGIFPDAPEAEFAEARLGDVLRSLGDASLAASLLGFEAQIDLETGLKMNIGAPEGKDA